MKKALILITSLLLITGCNNEKKKQSEMQEAAKDYYKTYMVGVVGVNKAEVTLEMLTKANKDMNKEYKLDSLKKCKKNSKVIFEIKDNEISKTEYEISCK
ncbi:MAG: hypothetical protein RRY22_00795 [Bacilli bacterium]